MRSGRLGRGRRTTSYICRCGLTVASGVQRQLVDLLVGQGTFFDFNVVLLRPIHSPDGRFRPMVMRSVRFGQFMNSV